MITPEEQEITQRVLALVAARSGEKIRLHRVATPTPRTTGRPTKPAILGSPSTPIHSAPKRVAYGIVGLLVCLTGALGNAVVTANLQNLQGSFAAWSTEIAWLPAVYVMTNVSINLLLVKFRQQFGLRAFTEGFLVLYVLVTFFHLFVNDLSSALMVRAAHGRRWRRP